MPLILEATPGHPNANTYATIAEANTYHESVMSPLGWTDADVPTKNRALATATRLLDANLRWAGERTYSTQALDWPRYGVIGKGWRWYLSHYEIPKELKDATSELARRLIENGMPDVASDTQGMKRLKAGPVEIEWEEGANAAREVMIDRYVIDMISHLTLSSSSSPSIVVPLIRV